MSEDGEQRQLGDFIRLQRQMADLSLRQMAELTKVSNAYLSQVERGLHQPSIRVLRSIAEALNLSADTLLTQAGLLDSPDGAAAATDESGPDQPGGTVSAILNDPLLSPEDRETLLRVYRSLLRQQ
jgi:transcriptional regulator with XRE-family HTH domain